jgi:hypothetical protein
MTLTCFVTNWGLTIFLGSLLALSEWIGRNPKMKENSILCFIIDFLRIILRKGNSK